MRKGYVIFVSLVAALGGLLFGFDKLGRKPLLLTAAAGMGLSFGLLGGAFYFELFEGPWVLILILSYVGFFALAMGPVVWVVMSEIFPTRIRGRAMSIATVFLWASCFNEPAEKNQRV